MIVLKLIGWVIAVVFVIFLWITSINLTKPSYNKKSHVWEEDPQSRRISNIAIALMIVIAYLLGYLNS